MPQDRRLRKAYVFNYFLNRGLDPSKVEQMDADIVNYMMMLHSEEKEKKRLEGVHSGFASELGINI